MLPFLQHSLRVFCFAINLHFRNVDKTIKAFLQASKSPEGNDARNYSLGHLPRVKTTLSGFPGIGAEAFEAQCYPRPFLFYLNNVNFNILA